MSGLRAWISGGSTPSVEWIVAGGHSSRFRWSGALVAAGVGIAGLVVFRRMVTSWWASEDKEAVGRDQPGQQRAPNASKRSPPKARDDSQHDQASTELEGSDDDWDSISAPREPAHSLAESVVMVPSKPSKSAATNLEKSVVFVSHEDEGYDDISDDVAGAPAGGADKKGWLDTAAALLGGGKE